MNTRVGPVQCGNCKLVLHEPTSLLPTDRTPCPICGALSRSFNVEAHEEVTLRTKVAFKHRRPGYKKAIYEEVGGYDLHRRTGLWSYLVRVIDRLNNRYTEEIKNAETGEVIRSVSEPLSDHKGRGSAKQKGTHD